MFVLRYTRAQQPIAAAVCRRWISHRPQSMLMSATRPSSTFSSSTIPVASSTNANRAQILDGKSIAKQILSEIALAVGARVSNMTHATPPPGLAVILVGARPDSAKYVASKARAARGVGFESYVAHFPDTVSEADVLAQIRAYNAAPHVHGILVQLPLPAHLDTGTIINAIAVDKDVDGFTPHNFGLLALRHAGAFAPWEQRDARTTLLGAASQMPDALALRNVPCTPKACMELLDRYRIPIAHRTVVVLGRSNIVGLPITLMLLHRRATVINISKECADAAALCRTADIVIAAIGQPRHVRGNWIKPGACVIDVGINFVQSQIVGDVDFEGASARAAWITPVPGGVGPMTVACLLHNTLLNCIALDARP